MDIHEENNKILQLRKKITHIIRNYKIICAVCV